jgi:hypothetical protein
MVSDSESAVSQTQHVYVDNYSFTRLQMTAGDFEYAEYLIVTMMDGLRTLGVIINNLF